jgi:hypothetical protein
MLRTENMLGALISYQSFFVNGSTLRVGKETKENAARQSSSSRRAHTKNPKTCASTSRSHRPRAAPHRHGNDALDAGLNAKQFHSIHRISSRRLASSAR